MNTRSCRTILSVIIMITSFASLHACSTFTLKPAQDVIRDRVQGLMNAKINNDWAKVYDFLSPSYKKTISKDNFARINRGVYFTKYAIDSIEVQPSGTEAKVVLTYDANMKGFDFNNNKETQTWIKSGWNWYVEIPLHDKNPLGK